MSIINFKSLKNSFSYALKGIGQVFREEQNFKIQIFIGLIVLVLGVYLRIEIWKAIVLILVITSVLVLELINSIFERLVDMLKPRMHAYVQAIKDIMAAAVLIASLCAVVIGILIFGPYLL